MSFVLIQKGKRMWVGLEWQVVWTISNLFLSRSSNGSSTHSLRSRNRHSIRSLSSHWLSSIHLTNVESTDRVEPAAIILMGINIESYEHCLSDLNIKTLQTLCAKDVEYHLARVLSIKSFEHEFLHFPFTTSTYSRTLWQGSNYLSL